MESLVMFSIFRMTKMEKSAKFSIFRSKMMEKWGNAKSTASEAFPFPYG